MHSRLFRRLAARILASSLTVTSRGVASELKIMDVEIFYHSAEHPDPYVYLHPERKLGGTIYFHKHKNGTYKSQNFKGIDLVFGDEDTYFGVLIRGIQHNGTYACGPSNVVNYILKLCNTDSISDVTTCISFAFSGSKLTHVWTGVRYRLPVRDRKYQNKPYRFIRDLQYTNKGRQTMVLLPV